MEPVATPEEFLAEMQRIVATFGADEEAAHCEMDDAICRLIGDLGYGDAVEVFKRQPKWYA